MLTQSISVDDKVTPLCRLYDRHTPTLYHVDPGDVGDVWDVSYHQGDVLVTVCFGLCVVVANQRCFERV